MSNEDYVSYDLALALRKAGFDWECHSCYAKTSDGEVVFVGMTASRDYNKPRRGESPFLHPVCSAPTLAVAQKWLREKKEIDISVWRSFAVSHGYHYQIVSHGDWETVIVQEVCRGRSYEQSLAGAIAAVLELIEKGE